MPYIKKERRKLFSPIISCFESILKMTFSLGNNNALIEEGDLNYIITSILNTYLDNTRENYSNYNSIIGVLECVKQELYRRKIGKYEDKKIKENDDVY